MAVDFPNPRTLVKAFFIGVLMLIVGSFFAALAVKLLDLSGGAAHDTSLVVAIAAFAISDFWGAGILTMLTKLGSQQIVISWLLIRLLLLLFIGLIAKDMLIFLPVQILLAGVAAWVGARVGQKQVELRSE